MCQPVQPVDKVAIRCLAEQVVVKINDQSASPTTTGRDIASIFDDAPQLGHVVVIGNRYCLRLANFGETGTLVPSAKEARESIARNKRGGRNSKGL